MGPEAAKSYAGHVWVGPTGDGEPAPRAKQEIDYGRRGKGYIFGAFLPATGLAKTAAYARRSAANLADFLEQVETWLPAHVPEAQRIFVILDNLSAHRATDILLFSHAHPRWEFVFQPVYAAYLNLVEPWWKVLRSLALKGHRFDSWAELCTAVENATAYWNNHRHPFLGVTAAVTVQPVPVALHLHPLLHELTG